MRSIVSWLRRRLKAEELPKPEFANRLTIALLTYNRADTFLQAAIDGILNQTYRDFEFLILDNGSTDRTAELVLGIDDPRIRYVRNRPGSSIEFNAVSAFQLATGQRVLTTHDDDIMEPTMAAEQMAFLDAHPEAKFVGTGIRRIDEHGRDLDPDARYSGEDRVFERGDYIETFVSERLVIMPSTQMFDRELTPTAFIDEHYYGIRVNRDVDIKISHKVTAGIGDVELPAALNTEYVIGYLDRPLLQYRLHTSQDSRSLDLHQPSIFLYMSLREHARKTPGKGSDEGVYDGFILKYELQKRLCQNQEPQLSIGTRRELRKIFAAALCGAKRSEEAPAATLPIYIAGKLSGDSAELPKCRHQVEFPAGQSTAARAYHSWAVAVNEDRSLFSSIPANARVVLFGSVLAAALLIMDAQRHGIEIVACLESNSSRHNSDLLGVPIYPPSWLRDHRSDFDLAVLTSEKDQEAYLRGVLDDAAGAPISAVSWKELAANLNKEGETLEMRSQVPQSLAAGGGPTAI